MTNVPQDVDLDTTPLTHKQLMAFYGKISVAPDPCRVSGLKSRCHLWTGSRFKNGYAQYHQVWTDSDGTHRRKNWKAHRLAWILTRGPIRKGLVLDHLCGDRACCNPDHLRLCTQAENVWRRPGLKLSFERAEEIRRDYQRGYLMKDIAAVYGVRQQTISAVINLLTWRPVANDNQESIEAIKAA